MRFAFLARSFCASKSRKHSYRYLSRMRIFEMTFRKTGVLPALANSSEFAFTAKGIIISTFLIVCGASDDVWRSNPGSRCFKNHGQRCYPVERKNGGMVMPYKSLLTFINTTLTGRNELLQPADSAFLFYLLS